MCSHTSVVSIDRHLGRFLYVSSTIKCSVWARVQFTRLSLAPANTRGRIRTHAAVSNSRRTKRSVHALQGEPGLGTTLTTSGAALPCLAEPAGSWAAHHACMKQTQCPSSGAKSPLWSELFPKLALAPRSQEKERERDINTVIAPGRWLGTAQSRAKPIKRFKVGLTT